MAFESRDKKPFSSCIQGIREDYLKRPVCHEVYGDLSLQSEMEWIITKCAERDTIRTRPFCESLGLTEDEASGVIHTAPRSKEQQLRQAVFSWSKSKSSEATLEKLLEALYIGDEVELVENICQNLLPVNISDERKVDPQEVYMPEPIKTKTVPHKIVQEEEVITPLSLEQESGPFLKPVRVSSPDNVKQLQLSRSSSDQDTIKPVSATEHGKNHAVMAWPSQQVIPSHLLHDKKELHVTSNSRTSSSSIQVQDGALENSLTFLGETSSPNMLLEARMNRLEREMKDMREESRREDAKLKDEIEKLRRELKRKDSEIQHLKKELKMETKQKQDAKRQLDIERRRAEASDDELKRKVEELKKQLREKDAQIEILKKKKNMSSSLEDDENDGASNCDEREYVHSHSEEDTSLVTNWKFEESKLLGCGNFGIVFKGLCQDTGRELAVKIVRDLNDKTIKSLEQEYNMLSTLRHKRIVSYLGVCYQPHPTHGEECLFIMTEFMPGGSLADFYQEKGPLNETLTRRYSRQILQGVEYLHQLDIIHRDIKGSNIMRNTRGHVKLADFGSAKKIFSETSEKNKTSYLYGTAPWAAPEVLRSESAQSQSDIWSIAATVVEMMTAERPYKCDPNIKDNSAIVYLVGANKLNPLQSVSVKKLIDSETMTEDAVSFLKECFQSVADERPAASVLLHSFRFCRKDT